MRIKSFVSTLTVLTLGMNLAACAEVKSPATQPTDSLAADFTLTDIAGKEFKLSDYRGKVVILDFWATWCPPCVKEIPHFNDLAKQYADSGLAVVGLSVDRDGVEAVNQFMANNPVDYRSAMSNEHIYGIYQNYLPQEERGGIPFTFIIDKSGVIREHFVGYRPKELFEQTIVPLLRAN